MLIPAGAKNMSFAVTGTTIVGSGEIGITFAPDAVVITNFLTDGSWINLRIAVDGRRSVDPIAGCTVAIVPGGDETRFVVAVTRGA